MAGNPQQRKLIIAAPLTTINLMIIWEVFSLSSEPIRTMSMHGCCETDLCVYVLCPFTAFNENSVEY